MLFPESKQAKNKKTTIIVVGQPVQCRGQSLKTAPQIHNFIPSKTTVTRYENVML